jgi:hypothetical protein
LLFGHIHNILHSNGNVSVPMNKIKSPITVRLSGSVRKTVDIKCAGAIHSASKKIVIPLVPTLLKANQSLMGRLQQKSDTKKHCTGTSLESETERMKNVHNFQIKLIRSSAREIYIRSFTQNL